MDTTADTATVRSIILARIERRARFGGMREVSVAMVANWPECDEIGFVSVERAIRSLIADGTVIEDMRYGALAFTTR